MAYTKRNFQKEQLLKADDLNAMDEQIAKNADDAGNAKASAERLEKKVENQFQGAMTGKRY